MNITENMKNRDPESHNLNTLYCIFGQKYKTNKQWIMFQKWYILNLSPFLWYNNRQDFYYLSIITNQIGGTDTLHEYQVNSQNYQVKIRYLEIHDRHNDLLGKILLMSPTNEDIIKNCMVVKLPRNRPDIAEICDLTKAFNCTNLTNHEKMGGIFLQIMLDYLTENKNLLKIHTAELDDNSFHLCELDPTHRIKLEKSRQLEGDDPFYMKFGFIPRYKSVVKKLQYNKNIMSQISTEDDFGLYNMCLSHGLSREIIDYIMNHQNQPLSKTLKYISRKDCVEYSRIYEILFKNIGLKEIDQTVYIKRL
jgi:hypothetical protein